MAQSYIEELKESVNGMLPEYLQSIGKSVVRGSMFSCVNTALHKHGDRNPSCKIDQLTDGSYLWYCHTCKVGGTVIDLAAIEEGLPTRGPEFRSTVVYLAEKLGIPVDHAKIAEGVQGDGTTVPTHRVYQAIEKYLVDHGMGVEALTNGKFGRRYTPEQAELVLHWIPMGSVDSQALTDHLVEQFGADVVTRLPIYSQRAGMLDPDVFSTEVLTMPLRGSGKQPVRFIGRASDEAFLRSKEQGGRVQKYKFTVGDNSKNKENPFMIDVALPHIRREKKVIVVEGQFDCVSMHLAGYHNTVASMGSGLTDRFADILLGYGVMDIIFIYDGDVAGSMGVKKALDVCCPRNIGVSMVLLPDGMDPDSMFMKGTAINLDEKRDALEYVLETDERLNDPTIPEMTRYTHMCNYIAGLVQNAFLVNYARYLARKFPFHYDEIHDDLKKAALGIETKSQIMRSVWRNIRGAEEKPLEEQIQVFEDSAHLISKMLAERNDNITRKTWNSFISMRRQDDVLPTKVYTGFDVLDSEASLLMRTLSVWSGPPSNGKSTLIRNVLINVLMNDPDKYGIYVSLDDDEKENILHAVALATRLPLATVRERLISGTWDSHIESQTEQDVLERILQEQLLVIGVSDCPDAFAIRRHIESVRVIHPNKDIIVVVDAFNDLADMDAVNQLSAAEAIIRNLKAWSDRYNCHIAVIAHMKKYDGSMGRRPTMYDLKGSSYIEHNARNVFIVHMPAHYDQGTRLIRHNPKTGDIEPVVIVTVGKDKSHRANVDIPFEFSPPFGLIQEPPPQDMERYRGYIEEIQSRRTARGGYEGGEEPGMSQNYPARR